MKQFFSEPSGVCPLVCIVGDFFFLKFKSLHLHPRPAAQHRPAPGAMASPFDSPKGDSATCGRQEPCKYSEVQCCATVAC